MILLKDLDYLFNNDLVIKLEIDKGEDYEYITFDHWYKITPMYRLMEVLDIYPNEGHSLRIMLNGREKPLEETENEPQEIKHTYSAEESLKRFEEWLKNEITVTAEAAKRFKEQENVALEQFYSGKNREAFLALTRLQSGEQQSLEL